MRSMQTLFANCKKFNTFQNLHFLTFTEANGLNTFMIVGVLWQRRIESRAETITATMSHAPSDGRGSHARATACGMCVVEAAILTTHVIP